MATHRRSTIRGRLPLLLGASAALACGADMLAGVPPTRGPHCPAVHRAAACPRPIDCLDGPCAPNVQTYGHYQTHWRTWPKALEVSKDPRVKQGVELPTQSEPPATEEELDAPPQPERKPGDPVDGEPVKPATGERPAPPPPDKPDPFRDDEARRGPPLRLRQRFDDEGTERLMSVLVSPTDDRVAAFPEEAADDEMEAAEASVLVSPVAHPDKPAGKAIQSSYETAAPLLEDGVNVRSGESSALRLVASDAEAVAPESAQTSATEPSPAIESPPASRPASATSEPLPDITDAPQESGNPLRSGWASRRSASRADKPAASRPASAMSNPLRK